MKNIAIFILITCKLTSVNAQEKWSSKLPLMWANFGFAILPLNTSVGAKIDVDVIGKQILYSLAYYNNSDLKENKPYQSREYFSFLMGRSFLATENLFGSISIGPSAAYTIDYKTSGAEPGGRQSSVNPGISFKTQLILHNKYVGTGLAFNADFNKISSYTGITLNISMGRFKI